MSRRIRFGDFLLDPEAGELIRASGPVALMPTEYRLLLYFVEHPNRLLAKEEILEAVWSDAHVTDASLARAVATLRDALRDDAKDPRYIETLPRRGYKFIAAITDDSPASPFRLFANAHIYPLRFGDNILGRGPESVVPIESTGVSRRHAIITVAPANAILTDLNSTNGTYVRGQKITEAVPLAEGDEIRIGPVTITFTSRQHVIEKTTDVMGSGL